MTRIKICGITNAGDARMAVGAGADALGFIAVPESPRFVTAQTMREIVRGLPPFLTKVVVAKTPLDSVGYPADVLQFYGGDEAAILVRRIRVFRIKDGLSLEELRHYRQTPDAILLDTYHEGALGGVGKTFDWSLALQAKQIFGDIPIILAGGLNAENVADAVRQVRPYAVDVSSGVEREPGKKDPEKIHRFIQAVRNTG